MSVIDEMKQAGAMLENGLHCGGFAKLKVSNGEKRRPAMGAKADVEISDLPAPDRPLEPWTGGLLCGDHFFKMGTSHRPGAGIHQRLL